MRGRLVFEKCAVFVLFFCSKVVRLQGVSIRFIEIARAVLLSIFVKLHINFVLPTILRWNQYRNYMFCIFLKFQALHVIFLFLFLNASLGFSLVECTCAVILVLMLGWSDHIINCERKRKKE